MSIRKEFKFLSLKQKKERFLTRFSFPHQRQIFLSQRKKKTFSYKESLVFWWWRLLLLTLFLCLPWNILRYRISQRFDCKSSVVTKNGNAESVSSCICRFVGEKRIVTARENLFEWFIHWTFVWKEGAKLSLGLMLRIVEPFYVVNRRSFSRPI